MIAANYFAAVYKADLAGAFCFLSEPLADLGSLRRAEFAILLHGIISWHPA